MNLPSIDKSGSTLRAILIEGEETRVRSMRIIPRESINFSPILLNAKKPLSLKNECSPYLRRSACVIQLSNTSHGGPKNPPKKILYTPKENRAGRRILCLSSIAAYFEGRGLVDDNRRFVLRMSRVLKRGQTFSMPSGIHLPLPHHLTNNFAAE